MIVVWHRKCPSSVSFTGRFIPKQLSEILCNAGNSTKATMLSYSLAFINSFKHQKRKIYQEVRILRYHYEEVWAMVVVFF